MRSDSRAAQVVTLAAEQGGVVTSRQARAVTSVSVQQLKRMVDSGVLDRLHHGLYRLARMPEDVHLDERVAWLALDPDVGCGSGWISRSRPGGSRIAPPPGCTVSGIWTPT